MKLSVDSRNPIVFLDILCCDFDVIRNGFSRCRFDEIGQSDGVVKSRVPAEAARFGAEGFV